MPEQSIDRDIEACLACCKTASLATADALGRPFAANIQYAHDAAYRLYWVSSEAAQHSENLENRADAAITIYAHLDSPELIHGLQLHGQVAPLDRAAAEDTLPLYTAKYPFVADPPFSEAVSRQRFYCFTPTWLRWIDNRRGFGWKIEKTFDC